MTAFRLGVNTCFAVKRWPRPEDWAPIVADVLGLDLVQHSLDLVELDAPEDARRAQAAAVREACAAAGLDVTSTFTGLAAYSLPLMLHPDRDARRRALAWYERAIAFTALSGGRRTGGHVGSLSQPDHADPARRAALWAELGRSLETLAQVAHDAGLEGLLVENMASAREPALMDDVRSLLAPGEPAAVPIELCLDVGHQCVPGSSGEERDPYAWLQRLGARAPIVHLQQTDADGDHHWPFTEAHNAEGRIEARRVLEAVEASGATFTELVIEVIPPFEQDDDQVVADLKATVDHWQAALAGVDSAA